MVNFAENIKPLSYVETHAAEVVEHVRDNGSTFVVTMNGEAAAVLMGARQYQALTDAVNLLKILALGANDIKTGRWVSQTSLDADVRALLET